MTFPLAYVFADGPWQSFLHGSEEIVESVGHDHVVVDGDDQGDESH